MIYQIKGNLIMFATSYSYCYYGSSSSSVSCGYESEEGSSGGRV